MKKVGPTRKLATVTLAPRSGIGTLPVNLYQRWKGQATGVLGQSLEFWEDLSFIAWTGYKTEGHRRAKLFFSPPMLNVCKCRASGSATTWGTIWNRSHSHIKKIRTTTKKIGKTENSKENKNLIINFLISSLRFFLFLSILFHGKLYPLPSQHVPVYFLT